MSEDRLYLHQLACEVAFRVQTAHDPAVALARFCDDLADEVAAGQKGLGDTKFLRAAFRDAIGYSTRVGPPHGRHCPCTACANEDWTRITAPCGMHGAGCPPLYAPVGEPDGESLTGGAATSGSPTALRLIEGGAE